MKNDIDVVIIGLNIQSTLQQCIESVMKANYKKGNLHLIYVDGGSIDNSISIAKTYSEVKTIELDWENPSPGLGRNVGWRAGNSPFVQFLDGDTQMDSEWLNRAVEAIENPNIAAVRGYRKELYPERSIYNWIIDQEWNDKPGEIDAFGGDVLIRREVLETTEGYNEDLIGGEDPELSLRVRESGWKILQLDMPMTSHDLAMTSLKQYWKRAYRTGYGFAVVSALHPKSQFWKSEMFRVKIRGGLVVLLFLCGILFNFYLWVPALLILLYPRLFSVQRLKTQKDLSQKEAIFYAWHCSVVVIPQFFGVLRYYVGDLLKLPLRNKPSKILG